MLCSIVNNPYIVAAHEAHGKSNQRRRPVGRKVISTDEAPAPVATYSQAVRSGPVVAVAGQVGVAPSGEVVGPGVAEQTDRALRNVEAILVAAGLTMGDALRVDCFLADLSDLAEFNRAYAAWFPREGPARTTVGARLAPGLRVQVAVLAVAPS